MSSSPSNLPALILDVIDSRGASADLTISPPWVSALIGYDHGDTSGVIAMFSGKHNPGDDHGNWDTEEDMDGNPVTVDWERVKWMLMATLYTDEVAPLYGPAQLWRIAVYEDGTGAYIWTRRVTGANHSYAFDLMVLLNTLNICNASNVYLAEPERPRAVRRRMERTGVRVSEIHVRSLSSHRRSSRHGVLQPGVPITSVRGHFAEYGPRFGKGLLFGKYEGKFWIPQHVRGSEEFGTVKHSYVVEP
jgi:hypothetical protein